MKIFNTICLYVFIGIGLPSGDIFAITAPLSTVSSEIIVGAVGVRISGADFLHLADVIPNTPAWKAGIRKGDLLISINGVPANGMTVAEICDRIRGEPGTNVVLEVESAATHQRKKVELTRAVIHIKASP